MSTVKRSQDPGVLLRRAAKLGETRNLKAFLQAFLVEKLDVDARDKEGWTALHLACLRGPVDNVYLLVKAGADINARTGGRASLPLSLACGCGYADIAQFLIKKGADVNMGDADGWTPLHWACQQGRVDTAEVLLSAGADVDARSNTGETPLDMVIKFGNGWRASLRESLIDLFRQYTPETVMETYCVMRPGV